MACRRSLSFASCREIRTCCFSICLCTNREKKTKKNRWLLSQRILSVSVLLLRSTCSLQFKVKDSASHNKAGPSSTCLEGSALPAASLSDGDRLHAEEVCLIKLLRQSGNNRTAAWCNAGATPLSLFNFNILQTTTVYYSLSVIGQLLCCEY